MPRDTVHDSFSSLVLMLYLLVARLEVKILVVGAALIVALLAVLLIRGDDQPRLECHRFLSFGIGLKLLLVHDGGCAEITASTMTGLALHPGQVDILIGGMALNALGVLLLLIVQLIKGNGMLGIFPGLIDLDVAGLTFLNPDIGSFFSRNLLGRRTGKQQD